MKPSTVSVIIPARNSDSVLGQCLDALEDSSFPIHEIIVVNDGSTDGTSRVAERSGIKVIDFDHSHGVNYCRNRGAMDASGDVLLFLDSDVVVQADTIQRVMSCLSDESVDAVVGIYSVRHRHSAVASQYKNLWIRFSYLQCGPRVDWVFGAVTAIRSSVVRRVQGFDGNMMMHRGGEDLELGKRMTASAHNILLRPDIEVEHLKGHTLVTLLKNDFARSQGFVRLAGKLGELRNSLHSGFVNIYPAFILSTILSWPIVASALLGLWFWPAWLLLVGFLIIYSGLNLPFIRYFTICYGRRRVPALLFLMFSDHLICALGSAWGLLGLLAGDFFQARRRRAVAAMSVGSKSN